MFPGYWIIMVATSCLDKGASYIEASHCQDRNVSNLDDNNQADIQTLPDVKMIIGFAPSTLSAAKLRAGMFENTGSGPAGIAERSSPPWDETHFAKDSI